MAAPEFQPRSLADWLTHLEPMQLPIDPAVRAEFLEQLQKGASASALSLLLLRDPALVLLLFREANRALARYDREAHTLEHAISLLGAGRMQTLAEQAPVLDPNHPFIDGYRGALMRSRHAASQARLWAEGTGLWPAEEVFWSTLLAAAPLWPLYLEAGPALQQIEQLRAEHGAVSTASVVKLLGCDYRALGAELAQRWLLPGMASASWRAKEAGSLRQWIGLERAARLDEPPLINGRPLAELCHHPALIVAVANAIAEEADWDWYSERALRLFKTAASACRRPLAVLLSSSHRNAAALSREYADTGLLTPGARLLGHWRQARLWREDEPAQTSASSASAKSTTNQPSSSEPNRVLTEAARKLRTPTEIGGVREVLELVVNTLHDGAGCKRVAALFVKPTTRDLQTVISAGADKTPALRQLRLPTQNNQLLTQLLAKPICLLLDADNRAKYWPHLPEDFRRAVGCENFVLMALFAKDRPVALLYADNAPGALVNGERQHTLFKQICQLASQCLSQLAPS